MTLKESDIVLTRVLVRDGIEVRMGFPSDNEKIVLLTDTETGRSAATVLPWGAVTDEDLARLRAELQRPLRDPVLATRPC